MANELKNHKTDRALCTSKNEKKTKMKSSREFYLLKCQRSKNNAQKYSKNESGENKNERSSTHRQ